MLKYPFLVCRGADVKPFTAPDCHLVLDQIYVWVLVVKSMCQLGVGIRYPACTPHAVHGTQYCVCASSGFVSDTGRSNVCKCRRHSGYMTPVVRTYVF